MNVSSPVRHGRFVACRRDQKGAAALVVVMLLFFIMSLVAAYTSRNLIFEQRTATNQYRSTQALEAAEAGIDWALTHLNAGRLTNACVPSASDGTATDRSFRDRYLSINTSTGALTPVSTSFGPSGPLGSVNPQCVLDTSDAASANWRWRCQCPLPDTATTALTAPSNTIAPAFILSLRQGARSDLVILQSNSCTRLDNNCLSFQPDRGGTGDGVATVQVTLALRGAITRVPTAPLTVLGSTLTLDSGAAVRLVNADTGSNGITVHTATTALPASGLTLTGLPGVAPAGTAVTGDGSLAPAGVTGFSAEDRKFIQFFGLTPASYQRQPGLPQLDCSSGCDAAAINNLAFRNPGRPLWLTGASGTVTIDGALGATTPVLLIVEGDVVITSTGSLNGLVYGRKANWAWSTSGSPSISGAVIAEGNVTFGGSGSNLAITYNAAHLRALRVSQGSFVRVPGSWRDF